MASPPRVDHSRPPPSDQEIEELVKNTHNLVWWYLIAAGIFGQDAEDLAQEAYVRAWQSWGNRSRLYGIRSDLAWMSTITRSVIARHYQRIKRRLEMEVAVVDDLHDTLHSKSGRPDELVVQSEAARQLMQLLFSHLSLNQRVGLVLHYGLGLSHGSIAEFLGIKETTSKQRVHVAIKRLHKEMQANSTYAPLHELSHEELYSAVECLLEALQEIVSVDYPETLEHLVA